MVLYEDAVGASVAVGAGPGSGLDLEVEILPDETLGHEGWAAKVTGYDPGLAPSTAEGVLGTGVLFEWRSRNLVVTIVANGPGVTIEKVQSLAAQIEASLDR